MGDPSALSLKGIKMKNARCFLRRTKNNEFGIFEKQNGVVKFIVSYRDFDKTKAILRRLTQRRLAANSFCPSCGHAL